jgi:acetylornithine/N-succinyldiaminopimelate aminotransferase
MSVVDEIGIIPVNSPSWSAYRKFVPPENTRRKTRTRKDNMKISPNFREMDAQYYMPAFTRDMMITRGSGSKVWDSDGKEYIDCVAGIAVCSTGHCHPAVVKAICDQAHDLIHCSNLYYVPHQAELAKKLVEISGLEKAFLSNSGAEANDGALKLARVRTGRKKFVSFTHGFHGRTIGSLAVTHKPAIREPFEPLGLECSFVEYGNLESLKKVVDDTTAAVLIEPVQGEAGVIIPPSGFIEGVREICDDHGTLMIADEVQTGMGRTGKWFGYQHSRVMPDIVTIAKGIASGFPMGALVARKGLEFQKSEHGSTFAGGPLACATALATIGVIEQVLPSVPVKAERFRKGLSKYNPRVAGLLIGMTIGDSCASIRDKCAEKGVIVNCAADGNLRLMPPLVISDSEIDRVIEVVNEAIG